MSRRRTKVLLVAPLPPPVGGIATWTSLMIRTPTEPDIERIHVNTSVGVYKTWLNPVRIGRQLRLVARVCWRILSERPDVIHVTTSYLRGWVRDVIFLGLARQCGAATIVNLRGGDFGRVYRAARPRRQRAIRRQLARCDAVVPITEESARFLRDLGLTNVRMIPNCIDVRPRHDRRSPPAAKRWLFVGYVMPGKGVEELFIALRQFPDAHLTLVGPSAVPGGKEGTAVLDRAARDPLVQGRFTHIDALPTDAARRVYPDHDLFVFPSWREGFPNVVLEAMEAALPIVTTRIGATPDMIVDGEHGLLVEPSDPDGLIAALRRLTDDPEWAARLGAAARRRAIALYEVGAVAATWYQLYRDVAQRARAAE